MFSEGGNSGCLVAHYGWRPAPCVPLTGGAGNQLVILPTGQALRASLLGRVCYDWEVIGGYRTGPWFEEGQTVG